MNVRKSFTALALLFLGWSAAHAEQYTIPLFLAPGASGDPQGVLRLVNDTGDAATVRVFAIADDGTRTGPATIALGASAAVQFDATELQSANAAKGLSGGLGSFPGDVRLSIDSDAPIVPLAFVRASDGTLSAMHDTVRPALAEGEPYRYEIPVFNPSTEAAQASRLRLINPGAMSTAVTIAGRDDGGAVAAGGNVTLTLPAGGARTLTAQQLEAGGTGLTGRLGAGAGRWRLTVSSDRPLQVVNVVASSTGRWNNLSTTAVRGAAPADAAGFDDRFVGESVVLEVEGGRFELMFMENGRVSETVQTDGMFATGEGGYDYVGLGPDAGRLTLDYDDGEQCRSNWYFSSRTGGWFASHCTGGTDAEETWSGGNWFVEDGEDDSGGGGPVETTYETDDALPGFDPGSDFFSVTSSVGGGVSGRSGGDGWTATMGDGGWIQMRNGTRYTCASSGGCEIVDGTVTRGSVTGRTAGSGGGEIDRFPVFPATGRPGNQTYTVGTAIDALTLPGATGGNPPLTYSLSPDVPGLSFDAAVRGLTGTPTEAGSYAMSYTVTDADGDLHTLHFTVEVGAGEADDHGDTFDTATSVSIPSTTPGELEEGKEDGDRDYFRVVVAAAGTLTVETTGRVDTYGTLFDGSRTQLATNDDGGSGTNFKIERQVQAGTYYVEVRGYSPTRTGTYELRVSGADDTSGGDGGGDPATTFGVNDALPGVPTSGTFIPNLRGGGSFLADGGGTTITLDNGSSIELNDGTTYTCTSSGGCTIENGTVTRGTIAGGAAGDGTGQDARPSFAAGSGPGNQTYTVGTAISALSLPTASGGDGALTYSLSPEVPGLSFNVTTRRLSGTPSSAGTYNMTYRARDVDGDTDSLTFTITVENAGGGGSSVGDFDLDDSNGDPSGIAHANGRFYVVDDQDEKVYVYPVDGRLDASADFDLDDNNSRAKGIAHANGRFYVVDDTYPEGKVYAYTVDGRRDASADFDLDDNNGTPSGIAHANGRFYVVDDTYPEGKVYAYTVDGRRDASADFDLDDNNSYPSGIAHANGRFYVVDYQDEKVYVYTVDGRRDASADFDLDDNNGYPSRIAHANGRFYVVDDRKVYAYTVDGQPIGDISPNLSVEDASASDVRPALGENFTFSVTVRNRGGAQAAATSLRYYRSPNATIDRSDTAVGTDSVSGLSASGTSAESISLTAPSSAGTYYYGACVDSVPGEFVSWNNCSTAVRVTVRARVPDLTVESASVSDDTPGSDETFVFTASVRNAGKAASPATTLRVYRSDNSSIWTRDTQVGTDAVSELAVEGASTHSVTLPAPTEAGTYYYRACVDEVAGELHISNNCSSAVTVYGGGPFAAYDLEIRSASLLNPFSGFVGQDFDMSVTVINRGPNRSQPAKLRFGSRGRQDIPALDSGETTTIRSTIGSIRRGTTSYTACIVEAPGEENESNNCVTRTASYL